MLQVINAPTQESNRVQDRFKAVKKETHYKASKITMDFKSYNIYEHLENEEEQQHGSLTLKSLTKWLWTKKSQDSTTKMHFAHTAIPVCGSSSSSNGSDDESDTPLIGVQ